MNAPDVGAFISTGGLVLIAVMVAFVGFLFWAAPRSPEEHDLWEDGADGRHPGATERRARTTLYTPPPADRRVSEIVPLRKTGRTDKWA